MRRSQRASGGSLESAATRPPRASVSWADLTRIHPRPTVQAKPRSGRRMADTPPAAEVVPCSLRQLLFYFLQLGTFGFGGPIALAGHMQRDLVEARRWISAQDYREGLALAQLSPGPLAAQLA